MNSSQVATLYNAGMGDFGTGVTHPLTQVGQVTKDMTNNQR